MGVLDGFYSTWSKARETFGQGTPDDGSQYDGSSKLMQMKTAVEAAAPDDRWQGSGADAYAAANKEHAAVYGKLAELDKKMAAEVKNAANVVTAGRENLDTTRNWVDSMVKSLPETSAADRERKLVPIANEGVTKVSTIVENATRDMTGISGRITGYKGEYDALTNQKFAPGSEKPQQGPVQGPPSMSTAPSGRWDGPPPAGVTPGTGFWAVDYSKPSDGKSPFPAPAPYQSGPPCLTEETSTGPTSGVLTVGGYNPQSKDARGFDLQNTYRFRISGTEFSGDTRMVNVDGNWYQAQWQNYQYEMNKIPVIQGAGDLGAITVPIMSEADDWQRVSIPQIIRESELYDGGTFYIPDGTGASTKVVDGKFQTSTPTVPIMRSGG
ncbi:hypothetical protein M1247_28510 [Mycobacterium sp. 21AC1]|uniref:EspA/EspE family type VII secretion system effector n=1 Tax=[Mycobacterium] appelbergii TaxID=2939269 RepID=UPI002938DBC8|nr:EspA/EspE family type VII secretion system effector [Mycobacterium sp. 21AC1]MDV3128881.1 hypothetical protein [Mycobacterium sp. 21AC1]